MTTTTLSQSTRQRAAPADWPENALPKHWIDTLFDKMTAFFGARFADAWRGADPQHVRKAWATELRKLSNDELKHGVGELIHRQFPPTLPEFYALCKQTRVAAHEAALRVENASKASENVVKKNVREIETSLSKALGGQGSVEWAFRMLYTGKCLNGTALPIGVRDVAIQAMLSPTGKSFMHTNAGADQYRETYNKIRNKYDRTAA